MSVEMTTNMDILLKRDCEGIDWRGVRSLYRAGNFDNGREAVHLRKAFENSFTVCFAVVDACIIGTARAISDGVGCATIFDVCVHPDYRRQGIGGTMVRAVVADLGRQSILLTTNDPGFYARLGFKPAHGAMVRQ